MSFYKDLAPYYETIFPLSDIQVKFVKEGMQVGDFVLDVGCGTGSLSLALQDLGFNMTGIDNDSDMVKRAGNRAEQLLLKPEFRCTGMLDLAKEFSANVFDAVLCFGNTLVHLRSLSEVEDFFTQCRKVLKTSGKFLIQIVNYDRVLEKSVTVLPAIDNEIIKFERYYHLYPEEEMVDFETILTVKSSGKQFRNHVHLLALRKQLLDAYLRRAGFDEVSFWGNFQHMSFNLDSAATVVVAQ